METTTSPREGQRGNKIVFSRRAHSVGRGSKKPIRHTGRGDQTATNFGSNRFPDVDGTVSSINKYDIRKYIDADHKQWDWIKSDNEVLELIHILYPIAKPYLDDFRHVWNFTKETTPGEFLSILVELIDERIEDDDIWEIFKEEGEIHVLYQRYYPQELATGHSIEIDWLENLPCELANLAFDVFGCLCKAGVLPLYADVDQALWYLEGLVEDIQADDTHNDDDYQWSANDYLEAIESYTVKGSKPYDAKMRIERSRKGPKRIIKELNKYHCSNKNEKQVVEWLLKGMVLLKDSIWKYVDTTPINDRDEYYAMIHEACSIHYSIDPDKDPIFQHVEESFSERANNQGIMNFSQTIDLKQVSIDDIPPLNNYPMHLCNWLDSMWDIYKPYQT